MRFVFLIALASCQNKSKLDDNRSAQADALWALGPDATELGLVATPRGVDFAARAFAAVRELAEQPDMAPLKPQIQSLSSKIFGSETATPADAGFDTKRGFAVFATADGLLAIMPVGDRDKFIAFKKGKRGSGEDTLAGITCRELRGHYVCATDVKMFDRLGKGNLRGKAALSGARGDIELYMTKSTLFSTEPGDLALVAQLEPGEVSVFARWIGAPGGLLARLAGSTAPHPDTKGVSGFVSINVAPLLVDVPPVPLAGDIMFDQLVKSFTGPISALIPAGSVDIQLFAPLSDPKPATTIIEHCEDLGKLLPIADKQVPGACRIRLQGTNALELDAWVENATLRLGAKKGPQPAGKPGALTKVGRELATATWSAVLWGRGTMLNLTGVTPAGGEVDPQIAVGIHMLSLLNELGAAVKVDNDGMRFRGYARTAWSNPPELAKKLIAISGQDIVTGKATEPAKALVASSAGTPFADDFAAGQGGLMVPAATIGLASSIVLPIVMRAMGMQEEQQPQQQQMDNPALTSLLVHAYVEEAFPKWQAEHPKQKCPATLVEVAKYFASDIDVPVLADPWGQPLEMKCDDSGLKVFSVGPDGKADTEDDVRSW